MELTGNNEMITSMDLLKKINELREKEYEEKAKAGTLRESEIKRGKFIELRHKNLLRTIKDEFSEEINGLKIEPVENEIAQGKFSLSKYLDEKGEKRDMYVLPLEKAKQVLMRESKFVRKAVIEYIDYLENQNRQLEELARI